MLENVGRRGSSHADALQMQAMGGYSPEHKAARAVPGLGPVALEASVDGHEGLLPDSLSSRFVHDEAEDEGEEGVTEVC